MLTWLFFHRLRQESYQGFSQNHQIHHLLGRCLPAMFIIQLRQEKLFTDVKGCELCQIILKEADFIMKKDFAVLISKEELADGIWSIWFRTDIAAGAVPGQFVLVFPGDSAHLLGRPVCICEINEKKDELRIVFRVAGAGTEAFTYLPFGARVQLEGPFGNGYPMEPCIGGKKEIVLMGGGIGAPSILQLAKEIKGSGNVHVVLGYRSAEQKHFLSSDFSQTGAAVHIASDDGSEGIMGTVIDAARQLELKPDIIYACGPMMMLKAVKEYAGDMGIKAYISLEERMACGAGACLGCVVRTVHTDEHSHVNNARICTEGPVFEAGEVLI